MALLPVKDAVARLLSGVEPVEAERVSLTDALGRVLAEDLAALRTQPPFPASAMDGYAVRSQDAAAGATLRVTGESRAGLRFAGTVETGEAVRIFTGAPVPPGADTILIQENAEREGDKVRVVEAATPGQHIRSEGLDFKAGDALLPAGTKIDARTIALAAAMNHAVVSVRRRPRVAILSTGDELVPPGSEPGSDQIISSNSIGLAAFVRQDGGEPMDLGIVADDAEEIREAVANRPDADVLLVSGGASVGDHDLVQKSLTGMGMSLDFWKIAMRPGKPLMVGSLQGTRVLGLPGNPVSSFVCAVVFLRPLLAALLGASENPRPSLIRLGNPMGENDGREDYVRAEIRIEQGIERVYPFPRQDSSMLSTLAQSGGLIVRPMGAPPAPAHEFVPVLRFDH